MNELHNNVQLNGSPPSDCLYIPGKSVTSVSSNSKRESNPQEDRLAQVIVERVIPPFAHSLKLQALVVYQADQEEMNCLMVNKMFRKDSESTYSEDLNAELSDSGFLDASFMTPLQISCNKSDDLNGCENLNLSNSHSRRKRKLSRPCKIPQSSLPSSPSTPPNSSYNGPPTPVPCANSPVLSPVNSTPAHSVQPNPLVIPSALTPAAPNPALPLAQLPVSLPSLSDSTEINKCTPPNGSLFLPVSAVTLLPHLSLFSLPMTVVSTVPRPILPRRSIDKPTPTRRILPTTAVQPSSLQLQQQQQTQSQQAQSQTEQTNTNNHITMSNSIIKPILPKEADSLNDDPNSANRRYAKSFICNQCRTSFSSLSLLCEHTFAVHKAFRCTICGANFTQRSNLQRHSLRHVGFKPFVCKVCSKAYYRKDHLVRHIELSHPGCDPRANLTVKLSSAESLDYLEQLKKCEDAAAKDPSSVVCQTVMISPADSVATTPVPDAPSSNPNEASMSPTTEGELKITLTPTTSD